MKQKVNDKMIKRDIDRVGYHSHMNGTQYHEFLMIFAIDRYVYIEKISGIRTDPCGMPKGRWIGVESVSMMISFLSEI